jgi:transcriptional regulator GlxA family with amidase domain
MDLALALVEDDLGPAVSLAAARPALRELQAWVAGHLNDDLSVGALAQRAHMSERSFARAFRAAAHVPPPRRRLPPPTTRARFRLAA